MVIQLLIKGDLIFIKILEKYQAKEKWIQLSSLFIAGGTHQQVAHSRTGAVNVLVANSMHRITFPNALCPIFINPEMGQPISNMFFEFKYTEKKVRMTLRL